jgi:hypothetical protein
MLYEPGDIIKVENEISNFTHYLCILEILVEKEINDRRVRRYRYYNIGNGDTDSALLMNTDGNILKYELHWRASGK